MIYVKKIGLKKKESVYGSIRNFYKSRKRENTKNRENSGRDRKER